MHAGFAQCSAERPSSASASGTHLWLFIPPCSAVSGEAGGGRAPRGVPSRETAFLAQTHAVSERSSSVARVSAALTSKTDLPAVPALLEAPA